MRYDKFIDELHKAGWRGDCDGQSQGIYDLWKQLFPSVYELEKELKGSEEEKKELLLQLVALENACK